jgi:FkbM family methyltransferase
MNLIHKYYLAIRKQFRLLLKGKYSIIKREGLFYLIDARTYIDRRVEAFGNYEHKQINYFIDNIQSINPQIFIDIGGNVGLYSLRVAKKIKNIRVVCYEPDLRNISQLYSNLYLNELYDIIEVRRIAISNVIEKLKFSRHNQENPGRSMISDDGEYIVETTTLDNDFQYKNMQIAIKIDVEGHELYVLEGAEQLLTQNDCLVQVESFDLQPVLEYMNRIGYKNINTIDNDHYFKK